MTIKETIGNAGTAGAVGGGSLIYWLDVHAAGLAVLTALISAIIGGVFYWLRYREQRRHNKAIEERDKGNQ